MNLAFSYLVRGAECLLRGNAVTGSAAVRLNGLIAGARTGSIRSARDFAGQLSRSGYLGKLPPGSLLEQIVGPVSQPASVANGVRRAEAIIVARRASDLSAILDSQFVDESVETVFFRGLVRHSAELQGYRGSIFVNGEKAAQRLFELENPRTLPRRLPSMRPIYSHFLDLRREEQQRYRDRIGRLALKLNDALEERGHTRFIS
ncbi:MAG: hypothetical protein HYT76_06470 [Deltaproteobacteria bacterium]|nr:hypothetical protein [Deltaproteobacteria bacterium]